MAHPPAMKDKAMTEWRPLRLGNQDHQIAFDLFGDLMLSQAQPATEPAHVGINRDTGNVKGIAKNHVRRLPTNSRQFDKCIERIGYLAVVMLQQSLATGDDVPCLVTKETRGTNKRLQFALAYGRECGRIGKTCKERRGDEVDACIGTLGRQDSSDEKLEGRLVLQGAMRVGIQFCELMHNFAGSQSNRISGFHDSLHIRGSFGERGTKVSRAYIRAA